MNDKCIETGTIQAFLDGETSHDLSAVISKHLAVCDNCVLALADAEEESAIVFSALDREFDSLVPTQRLWSSINEALAVEKSKISFWDKIRISLSSLLANPSLTVAASVLVVFGIFAAVWSLRPAGSNNGDVSSVSDTGREQQARPERIDAVTMPKRVSPKSAVLYKVDVSNLSNEKVGKLAKTANFRQGSDQLRVRPAVIKSVAAAEDYLPGEESYMRTISDLKQNVDGQKDRILNPSSRIAYERDMAVVNDSIGKMKEVVKKNPKNQSAKQVLYSSYQNKIDLLNSVVEREELMASLVR